MSSIRRVIGHFSTILKPIAMAANTIGTLMVLVLVVALNIDVVARGVFNAPFLGVVEVVIFSMVLIVFLQLPDVVRVNRLMRSDGFLVVMGERFPSFGRFLSCTVDGMACVFMGLIAWTMLPEFQESIESCHYFGGEFGESGTFAAPVGQWFSAFLTATGQCDYFGTPGVFTAPWWPAKLAITFSAVLCCLLFAVKTLLGQRDPERAQLSSQDEPPPV